VDIRQRVVIGTRGSTLALWQANWVAAELRHHHPDLTVEVERIVAPADAMPDVPLAALGTKGLFTKTLEDALLNGHIDLAVHSLKDLASVLPPGLTLAAVPPREDPREALVVRPGGATGLDDLPRGARVGTSAPRRRAQLRYLRPDLRLEEIRGNVDTRLRKLQHGDYDALVLAAAGLHRLGRGDAITAYIDPAVILPAGGQGALGIETRAGDEATRTLAAPLSDPATTVCCQAERRLQEVLEGGCRVPIGALARVEGATLMLQAVVASEDGLRLVRDALSGPVGSPLSLADRLAARLLANGADAILEALRAGS